MKPCHDNNCASISVERAATLHNHALVEYLNGNVSVGELFQQCGLCTDRAKKSSKNIRKKFVRLHYITIVF